MNAQLSICNTSIRQFDGLYSLNDLHKAAGGEAKHQPNRFIRNEQAQALIDELNRCPKMGNALITKRGGEFQGTFACKELVYAYAMWISAAFMLQVIRAYDAMVAHVAPQIQTATPEQKQHIKSLVIKRVSETGASYSTMWNVVFEAAGFNKLENLTPASYERACAFFKVETLTGEWEHVKTPRLNIPTNDGRYLLVIRGSKTTVINAENHNLIEAVHARKIQADMQTMRLALQDLSHRMQLLYGDVNDDVVAQPLEIAFN